MLLFLLCMSYVLCLIYVCAMEYNFPVAFRPRVLPATMKYTTQFVDTYVECM